MLARFRGDGSVVESSFSVVIVLEGEGVLEPEHGSDVRVSRGSTVLYSVDISHTKRPCAQIGLSVSMTVPSLSRKK